MPPVANPDARLLALLNPVTLVGVLRASGLAILLLVVVVFTGIWWGLA